MVFKNEKQRRGFFSRLKSLKQLPQKIEMAREQRQEGQAIALERQAAMEQAKLEGLRRRLEARVKVSTVQEERLKLIKKQSDELLRIRREEAEIKRELFKRTALGQVVGSKQAQIAGKRLRKEFKKFIGK